MTRDELDAIKARIPRYGGGDMRALLAEVERLRSAIRTSEADANALDAEAATLRELAMTARSEERAAVVAWLRHGRWVEKSVHMRHEYDTPVSSAIHDAADIIERGEHRREEEK